MPKIVGKSVRVVDHDGLTIDECAGNVASNEDTLSIAMVKVEKPTTEPWLTLHYDEWICVTKGLMELHSPDGTVLKVKAGDTAFVAEGEKFRPIFPEGGVEYVPICLPAFRPDRCIREEGGEEQRENEISSRLKELHGEGPKPVVNNTKNDFAEIDKLYHMCQKSVWEECVAAGKAYFPPTFHKDGMFTHATAVPERLIDTANHFYTLVGGEWICLEVSRSALLRIGIDTVFEEAKPVGDTGVSKTNLDWVFPHIYVSAL